MCVVDYDSIGVRDVYTVIDDTGGYQDTIFVADEVDKSLLQFAGLHLRARRFVYVVICLNLRNDR
jgi:hypothetical protein